MIGPERGGRVATIIIAVRTDFDPASLPVHHFYKLLTAVVVPRPIAWVSSTSAAGVDNLAPHSFFTVACRQPPIVQFTSVGRKDTLRNVEATGEFVVNFATEPLFEQVNATATDFPPDTGEFDAVGLEREPSLRVKPPRVALECRLVVFGEVVHAAVDEAVLAGRHPDVRMLRPLSRLGRNEWGTLGEVLTLSRIPFADWNDGKPTA
jgi:flavin reductase (DIM6/NTAB) family NADH-FMN oxidoreductase RutF